MIDEMRAVAKKNNYEEFRSLKKPVLMIISQGKGNAAFPYAHFFAMGHRDARLDSHFTVSGLVSWSPKPSKIWQ